MQHIPTEQGYWTFKQILYYNIADSKFLCLFNGISTFISCTIRH